MAKKTIFKNVVTPKPLLSIPEAAYMLGMANNTIRNMIYEGELPASKIRGQWRIKQQSVELLIDSSTFLIDPDTKEE